MAKVREEHFWFITSITNSVLGLYLIFRWLFSSWFLLPIIATVAVDLLVCVLQFSRTYRHQTYFTNKPKILQSFLLEVALVIIFKSIFSHLGYKKWVAPIALVVYGIPAFIANYRKPCRIPQMLLVGAEDSPILYRGGIFLWGFRCGKDTEDHVSQLLIGFLLVVQSSEFFAYHLYMETDRHMQNAEYFRWLLQQIRQGAVDSSQMMADLFMARGYILDDLLDAHQLLRN